MVYFSKISLSSADHPARSPPYHKPAQEKPDMDGFIEISSNLEENTLDINEGDYNYPGHPAGELSGLPDFDFEEVEAEEGNRGDDDDSDDSSSFSVISDDGLTKNVETNRLCDARKLLWDGTKTVPASGKKKAVIGNITESVKITRKTQAKTLQSKKLSPDIFGTPMDSDVTTTGDQITHHVSGPSSVKESNKHQAGQPKGTASKKKTSTSDKNNKDAKLSSAGTASAHPDPNSLNEHERHEERGGPSKDSATTSKVDGLDAGEWDIVGYPEGVMPHKLSDGLLSLEWDDLMKAVDSYMHGPVE